MKKLFSMLALLPCTLFLAPGPLTSSRVLEFYDRIVFESASNLITIHELADLQKRGDKDDNALFELTENGVSELEPVRQALARLRLLASHDLSEIAPLIRERIDQKLKLLRNKEIRQDSETQDRELVLYPRQEVASVLYFSQDNNSQNSNLFVILQDRAAQIWTTDKTRLVDTITLSESASYAHLLSGNRYLLVRCPKSKSVWLYDLKTKSQTLLDYPDLVRVSPQGDYVLMQHTETKRLYVWSVKTLKQAEIEYRPKNQASSKRQAWFTTDGTVVIHNGQMLEYYNPDTGELKLTLDPNGLFEEPRVFSRDKSIWFNTRATRDATLWDAETAQIIFGPVEFGTANSWSMRISGDSKSIIRVFHNKIVIWSIEKNQETLGIPIRTNVDSTRFLDATSSPDGRYLVTIQHDKKSGLRTLILREAHSGKPLTTLEESHEEYNKLEFSSDSKTLTALTCSQKAFIWNLEKLREDGWKVQP